MDNKINCLKERNELFETIISQKLDSWFFKPNENPVFPKILSSVNISLTKEQILYIYTDNIKNNRNTELIYLSKEHPNIKLKKDFFSIKVENNVFNGKTFIEIVPKSMIEGNFKFSFEKDKYNIKEFKAPSNIEELTEKKLALLIEQNLRCSMLGKPFNPFLEKKDQIKCYEFIKNYPGKTLFIFTNTIKKLINENSNNVKNMLSKKNNSINTILNINNSFRRKK